MRHPWLTVRMVVAGAVVFGIYALFAVVAHGMGLGLPVVLAASVAFVAFQYKLGTWLALRSADAEDLPADRHPRVHEAVERLSAELGIEQPRLMLGEMGGPNAFPSGAAARGRSSSRGRWSTCSSLTNSRACWPTNWPTCATAT